MAFSFWLFPFPATGVQYILKSIEAPKKLVVQVLRTSDWSRRSNNHFALGIIEPLLPDISTVHKIQIITG
jgi:hypothetical protein